MISQPVGLVIEVLGTAVGVVLTLMVLSYLLGDNPVYRLALHTFLGAVIGYGFGVVSWEVLILRVGVPLFVNRQLLVLVPLFLGLLLLVKAFPRRAYVGNLSMGFLVGVGAAVALSGALLGAIVPQVNATARAASPSSWRSMPLRWLDGLLVVVGTICTLVAFGFVGRRARRKPLGCVAPARALAVVGRWFLVVVFGIAFAGAITAALTMLIGRIEYIVDFVRGWF